ncbi:hypothetical protein LMG28140_06144 [Paraburkholderia metrosideri]|jgi:hypothetical protein|uniref:Uncharacterized protein n=2 Tax=Paraburkholderia metrosideri TaxID=580937 RepID=A0ABM8P691_9BURK|nr:hypothetical protein LMG28140_06144 [Paraburkholderia metrosideri]
MVCAARRQTRPNGTYPYYCSMTAQALAYRPDTYHVKAAQRAEGHLNVIGVCHRSSQMQHFCIGRAFGCSLRNRFA